MKSKLDFVKNVKKETTKKTVTKKEPVKKTVAKNEPAKKPVTKKKAPVKPVKKISRRLTNKERKAASFAIAKYMLLPGFDAKSESGKLLISAFDKIRAI